MSPFAAAPLPALRLCRPDASPNVQSQVATGASPVETSFPLNSNDDESKPGQ
jgi:hypothetical protein